jgi:sulfite exporter TauE/SafE
MLASISPVGEAARHQRWTVTVTAYVVGATLGGAATGVAAGVLGAAVVALTGRPSTSAVVLALAAIGLLAALADRPRWRDRLPAWRRQVDERWLTTYRGWVYGLGFGWQLGGAVWIRIPSPATYLWLVAAAATASPAAGASIGAAFGFVRALPLLATRSLTDPARLHRFHARLDGGAGLAERATRVGLVLVAATALAATAA